MKGLFFDGELKFRDDLPMPSPKKGEALVRVLKAGICRTDLEIAGGYMNFRGIPGHEFVGVVEEAGDGSLRGSRVVGEINCGCGVCGECGKGNQYHCQNRTVLGIQGRDGAFAEYIAIPEQNLHHVPDSVSDDEAIFTEPLAAAFRVAEQTVVRGVRVLVLGDGKLGLLIAQVLAELKADVTLCGKHSEKMALVEGHDIATVLLDDLSEDSRYETVVDATGNPDGVSIALRHTRPKGTLVLKTTVADPAKIDLNHVVINEINIKGSRCGPFEHALTLLEQKMVTVKPLIGERFSMEDGLDAFRAAGRKGALKVIIG